MAQPKVTASPKLLEARHLTRRHPENRTALLNDVSLTIEAGMRIVVEGSSGAGKTLLLRALVLLDRLDAGEILWQGRTVRHDSVPPLRRAVSYLHQRAVMLEETVEGALRRPYALQGRHGVAFDREVAERYLSALGRDGSFMNKRTAELSGGEIQITAIVRALQLDPTILLLDEPTAALDAQAALAVETLIAQWIGEQPQRAFVWVSHNAEQARRMGRQFARMESGRLTVGD
jgi:putative ABC transport system ATP-binding protein